MNRIAFLFSLFSVLSFESALFANPHIVFLLGEKEYKTLETVPEYFETELKPRNFTATFFAAPPEGEKRDDFSGLAEALQKADLCFISVRRRALAKEDMQALKQFVADGKPLVAIRTSSHAFHLRGKPAPEGRELWEEFDQEILGGNYHGHYGKEPAKITVTTEGKDHPILKGIGKLPDSDKLYQTSPLADSARALLLATIEGKDPEPVAWTHRAGEKKARMFYTSLGQVGDFDHPEFRKFMTNAIQWTLEDD